MRLGFEETIGVSHNRDDLGVDHFEKPTHSSLSSLNLWTASLVGVKVPHGPQGVPKRALLPCPVVYLEHLILSQLDIGDMARKNRLLFSSLLLVISSQHY